MIKPAFGTSIDGLNVSAAKKYTADLAVYGNVASRRNNMFVGHASYSLCLSFPGVKNHPMGDSSNLPISTRNRFMVVTPRWCWDRIRYPSRAKTEPARLMQHVHRSLFPTSSAYSCSVKWAIFNRSMLFCFLCRHSSIIGWLINRFWLFYFDVFYLQHENFSNSNKIFIPLTI